MKSTIKATMTNWHKARAKAPVEAPLKTRATAAVALCMAAMLLWGCASPGTTPAAGAPTPAQAASAAAPSRMDAGSAPFAARYLIHLHGPRCEH